MKLGCRAVTFPIHNIVWVTFTGVSKDVAVCEETFAIGNPDAWNLLLQVCEIKCLTLVMPQLGGQRTSSLLRTGFSYRNLLVFGSRYCLLFVHRINLHTDGRNIRKGKSLLMIIYYSF